MNRGAAMTLAELNARVAGAKSNLAWYTAAVLAHNAGCLHEGDIAEMRRLAHELEEAFEAQQAYTTPERASAG
jgi:hypothetical protein